MPHEFTNMGLVYTFIHEIKEKKGVVCALKQLHIFKSDQFVK